MQPLVTLEWAVEYFATSRPKADEWDTADDVVRQQFLGWASVLVDSAFTFHAGVNIYEDDRVRAAVCEQALWLMRRKEEYPEVLTNGIVSASVGAVSATFSKDFVAPLIGEMTKMTLAKIAYFCRDLAVVQTMPLGGVFSDGTY
jgi:hypothetical protein